MVGVRSGDPESVSFIFRYTFPVYFHRNTKDFRCEGRFDVVLKIVKKRLKTEDFGNKLGGFVGFFF